ncbi:NCS1 family nucleobase:cation symporter-1 [Pedosphaera parvula]|uniref:NCS1 nucleoside transporter family n=1 Tax=Pedosphaera parvula (strain Ellin514) TaxID=320771 RepID=B9XKX7_PEDPL|nr:NCS1 family nucleobase:cation symporter-1 [Pedosphaera parvula]EEF59471.1 NCS1 nucleoside transporter family [Pedosphaera parvula Ellin514]
MPALPEQASTPDELIAIEGSHLYSPDLAPVPPERRKWGMWNFAALWISMAACIPTYMLASSLIDGGMNWWQAILTIFLANLIVLIPMILNAHAGTRYGIPFPVFCRASFGTHGANVPALLRALVACGWFGIQAWIGGNAIFKILAVFVPSLAATPAQNAFGITFPQFLCFMLFWGINMWVIYKGIDSIRLLLSFKAPLLIVLGLLLLGWAYSAAGGFGPMLSQPSAFDPGQPKDGQFWKYFVPALTGMIGFWATLSLNIPDFSRYAKSQRDQVLGQTIGLPPTMALYAFIGVAVTSATTIIFKKTIWDPVDVLTHFTNPFVLIIAMLALCIATLATNLAANVVSPANDFANLAPKFISFRTGGLITGIIGVLIMPWKLLANPSGYIFTWLVGYSALLGPIGGIMIADYFLIRKCKLSLVDLYKPDGEYRYTKGFSLVGLFALIVSILPNVPGFLATINVIPKDKLPPFLMTIYSYAWFVGFLIAFLLYSILRSLAPAMKPLAGIKPSTPALP